MSENLTSINLFQDLENKEASNISGGWYPYWYGVGFGHAHHVFVPTIKGMAEICPRTGGITLHPRYHHRHHHHHGHHHHH